MTTENNQVETTNPIEFYRVEYSSDGGNNWSHFTNYRRADDAQLACHALKNEYGDARIVSPLPA